MKNEKDNIEKEFDELIYTVNELYKKTSSKNIRIQLETIFGDKLKYEKKEMSQIKRKIMCLRSETLSLLRSIDDIITMLNQTHL